MLVTSYHSKVLFIVNVCWETEYKNHKLLSFPVQQGMYMHTLPLMKNGIKGMQRNRVIAITGYVSLCKNNEMFSLNAHLVYLDHSHLGTDKTKRRFNG